MTSIATIRCPICGRQFRRENSTALPFCSPRCKQIDLGRWLGESYGMPIEGTDDADESDEQGEE